ncbi:hypothetical protein [Moorena sp. SIOASIH]|uniref:hypothetical protein n=1 Tax=Moorena sp. SIOASIH TaxID=2607817 RepID=UPI0025F31694|nr:hypothetical protein [Moorena sp. SIOASIH]
MSILPNFLRSLVITILLSFMAPVALVIGLLAGFGIIGYIPALTGFGLTATTELLKFLTIFGNGSPIQGVLVIAFTCSLVGALFDLYACARYHNLNDN